MIAERPETIAVGSGPVLEAAMALPAGALYHDPNAYMRNAQTLPPVSARSLGAGPAPEAAAGRS